MMIRQRASLRIMPSRLSAAACVALLGVGLATLAVAAREPGAYRLCLASLYLATLAWLAVHDIHTLTAPNRVVYSALALGVALSIPLGAHDLTEALLGGFASFLVLLIIAILGRGAMGFGDVKVAAIAGLAVGFHGVPVLLLATFGAGGIYAAAMLLLHLRKRKDVVAFTPLLAISVAICFVVTNVYLVHG